MVASFYPLAWVAERVGGPRVDVIDLTPPGAEAHDTTLSARARADLGDASLVLLLGLRFQPEVERAARDANGRVVDVARGLPLLPSSEGGLEADPHVWLDPVLMLDVVDAVVQALVSEDPAGREDYERRAAAVAGELRELDAAYREALSSCSFSTMVVTHEAFGYLAARYGLQQLGITGVTPEGEPTADRLRAVSETVDQGKAGAVFFEGTDEGERLGTRVAGDLGVPALPLATLESAPPDGDYLSAMRANLESLSGGLACP